ncbi:MAG: hypothetical protein COA49_08500 [Bacteroidetes bacterium]|nr:MAG: hypothetical protein COA49_08500 [Bacteroidota bacterium]
MHSIQLRISIIGTGRVAISLGREWRANGVDIVEVYGRSLQSTHKLSEITGAIIVDDISKIRTDIDALAIIVSDDAIKDIASLVPSTVNKFHCSGVTAKEALGNECGVLWPIKSINPESINENFRDISFGVEASSESFSEILNQLVKVIHGKPFYAPLDVRAKVHLAAVFTDNFANHCLALSQTILSEANLPKNILNKLAEDMARGAIDSSSFSRQTGVALRHDYGSQKKHLELLYSLDKSLRLSRKSTSIVDFYKFLSKHIADSHELQN